MRQFERLEAAITKELEALAYELVDCRFTTEHGRYTLLIMIDRPEGIRVSDCERVSKELSFLLEEQDWGLSNYQLEVSSPGVERPLKKESDFKRFKGRKVFIRTREPIAGRRNFQGLLNGFADEHILIECEGQAIQIPLSELRKAYLIYET